MAFFFYGISGSAEDNKEKIRAEQIIIYAIIYGEANGKTTAEKSE